MWLSVLLGAGTTNALNNQGGYLKDGRAIVTGLTFLQAGDTAREIIPEFQTVVQPLSSGHAYAC